MSTCFNHGEREGTARCAVCGKSLCEECVIREGDSSFCSAECRQRAAECSNDVLPEKKKTASFSPVRKLIYFFVLLGAIAAAYHFYVQNEKKVDQRIKNSFRQVEKKGPQY